MEAAAAPMPDAGAELDAGRVALVAGSVDEAAFRFSLALRMAPALAPAVLEATSGARGTSLLIVRGDAYRLAGHEDEARQAYAVAAQGGLPERRRRPRPRQKTRVGTGQGDGQGGTDEVALGEVDATAADEPASTHEDAAENASDEHAPTAEHAPDEHAPAAEHAPAEHAPAEHAPDEHAPTAEHAPTSTPRPPSTPPTSTTPAAEHAPDRRARPGRRAR